MNTPLPRGGTMFGNIWVELYGRTNIPSPREREGYSEYEPNKINIKQVEFVGNDKNLS